jgi:hypothetical protein
MARNAVQFQKGLSEAEFTRLYGTEQQCRAIVIAARWPEGFICPACGGRAHSTTAGFVRYLWWEVIQHDDASGRSWLGGRPGRRC